MDMELVESLKRELRQAEEEQYECLMQHNLATDRVKNLRVELFQAESGINIGTILKTRKWSKVLVVGFDRDWSRMEVVAPNKQGEWSKKIMHVYYSDKYEIIAKEVHID